MAVRSPLRSSVVWLTPLLITISAAAQRQQYRAFPTVPDDKGLARYETCMKRLPFRYHTDGRQQLASSGDPRGLEILAKDYNKPGDYPD